MKNKWTFADIIDLDYFSNLDRFTEEQGDVDLHRRDRQIALESEGSGLSSSATHEERLAAWLARRRIDERQNQRFLPGDKLHEARHFFSLFVGGTGLLLGMAAAASYFVYTGQTPLNVFTFLGLFLLPQLLLLAVLSVRSLTARLAGRPRQHLHRIMRPLFVRFVELLKKSVISSLDEQRQRSLRQLLIDRKSRLLGWPLFTYGQLFGVAFNLGLLLITFSRIATTDLAFGWQTTLQIGAEGVSSLVRSLALPWSWFLPADLAHPTLAQIEGSRIILKEGIYHLSTANLTAWWPFLLMSLLIYGFLPRLVLLLFASIMERRNTHIFLRQRRFHSISTRMRTPLVSSQALVQEMPPHAVAAEPSRPKARAAEAETSAPDEVLVLLPAEVADTIDDEQLRRMVLPQGYRPAERRVIFADYDADQALLAHIAGSARPVLIFLEAWMAPIREHLLFLEQLSRRLQGHLPLLVYLLGRPGKEGPQPPRRSDVVLWKEQLASCGDVALVVEAEGTAQGDGGPRS